jgi:uncharacterized protein YaiI (UPF0178 family)
MNIWVDADACPGPIKQIIFRAAMRTGIKTILVANHRMKIPKSGNIQFKLVGSGFDKADNYIANTMIENDLLISNDIPLAAAVVDKGCKAISTKGEQFTKDNIKERLNIRDFMDTLRASGVNTGGPPPLSQSEIKSFADSLDRILTQFVNNS